jgi:hypothetical protein
MATQAVEQLKSLREWSLEDYLAELAGTSGCKPHVALPEMQERIKVGRLILIRQRLVNDKPYNPFDRKPYDKEEVDPCYDFCSLSLVSDFRVRGGNRVRVHVISDDGFEYRYTVAELPQLSACHTTPAQQLLENKPDSDPVKITHSPSAGQPRQKPLTTKKWLEDEIKRREDAGDIPKEITEFSGQIRPEMEKAARAGIVKWVVDFRTIEHYVRTTTKLFPKKKRSPKS